MQHFISRLRQFCPVIHPFLFAIYPVAALFSHNVTQIPIAAAYRSIIFCLVSVWVLLFFFWILLRDWHRAGFIVTLMGLFFFSFGHLYAVLHIQANILYAVYAACLIIGVWWIARKIRRGSPQATKILNATSLAAILIASWNPVQFYTSGLIAPPKLLAPARADRSTASIEPAVGQPPDIYYIILDGFGREDTLRDLYGIESLELFDYLRNRGFTITDLSYANYILTIQSITSSLNYEYVQDLVKMDPATLDSRPLQNLVDHNQAAAFLRLQGYRFVMVSSGFAPLQIHSADQFIEAGGDTSLTAFETSLLFNTALAPWMEGISAQVHRNKTKTAFNEIAQLAKAPGPKFVFAHILLPHPPFLFHADGSPSMGAGASDLADGLQYTGSDEAFIAGYREQLVYTARRTQEMVAEILEQSENPPVIILQGDHGPEAYWDWFDLERSCLPERFGILNALYLPGDGEAPPDDMTPVNTFRYIFNRYFGAGLAIYPNQMYAMQLPRKFDYINVTQRLDQCPIE